MQKIAAICALTALAAPALADLADQVRCREIGFSKAVETQDHELFSSFIDPDARFVGGKVDRGRETIAEAWKVFFTGDLPKIMWRPKIIEVLESGDLALSRGPYRIIDKNSQGETTEAWGTFNSVWRLTSDGEWLVVFDAGGPLPEPPPAGERALLDQPDSCDTR